MKNTAPRIDYSSEAYKHHAMYMYQISMFLAVLNRLEITRIRAFDYTYDIETLATYTK